MSELAESKGDAVALATSDEVPTDWKSFELRAELMKGISELGWTAPLPVQARALPVLLFDKTSNLIAQAPTGKGKTGAFALGVLQNIDESLAATQAIVVCPTRELATQCHTDQFLPISRHTGIKILLAIKDAVDKTSSETFNHHVIIGTPGTMVSLLKNGRISLDNVRMCVVDEADMLINEDKKKPSKPGQLSIVQQTGLIGSKLPRECRKLMFSATYSAEALQMARRIAKGAHEVVFQADKDQKPTENVFQFVFEATDLEQRFEVLRGFLTIMDVGNVLVFCNKTTDCDSLYERLAAIGFGAVLGLHHGKIAPEVRDLNIKRFKAQEIKILIASDVLARGLDVSGINFVVNFEVPVSPTDRRKPDHKEFIHRVGRAGRLDRKGVAITFVSSPVEKEMLNRILEEFKSTSVVHLKGPDDPSFMERVIELKDKLEGSAA